MSKTHFWSIWYPRAGSTGILVGRGMLDPTDRLLVHAAPELLTVEVHDADGNRIALGQDLEQTDVTPMCLLRRDASGITRRDIWPDDEHVELPVLLPGGEVGILKSWWNAEDRKEWRWDVTFYNSIR